MNRRFLLKLSCGMLATSCTFAAATQTSTAPTTEQDKLSYTIGVDLGKNFQSQSITVNPAMIAAGMNDVLSGGKLALSDAAMKQTLASFQEKMMAKQEATFKKMSSDNAKAGEDFLAKNKLASGVTVLPTGLQYKIIKPGSGTSPTANDTVTVDYEGKLVNGDVFDSTYTRGKPATFKVSQVIQGWQQALKMMTPGAEWMVYIPAKLAYGERGAGTAIGPNETLIFKIHLISVNKAS